MSVQPSLPPTASASANTPIASPLEQHSLETESLRERMEVMFWQEITHYRTKDYLVDFCSTPASYLGCDGDESIDRDSVMSEQWRTRMCEWAYQLVDHFDFPREIVGTCTNLLDRYLAAHFAATVTHGLPTIDKQEFQLVTMCCLYLSMKLKGHSRVPLEYMVQLSRGTVDELQLQDMEMEVCTQLCWLVNPPTSFDFLKHYLQLLQPSGGQRQLFKDANGLVTTKSPRVTALEDLAAFLVELSVLDYYFVNFRHSTVALAALFNAMDEDPELQPSTRNPFLEYKLYHGYAALILTGEESNVYLCRQRLGSLHHNAVGITTMDDDSIEPASPSSSLKGARITSPVSVTNMHQYSL